jgi:hypothetical protein
LSVDNDSNSNYLPRTFPHVSVEGDLPLW